MSSREKILSAIKKNQPALSALPEGPVTPVRYPDTFEKFSFILKSIGGTVIPVTDHHEISTYISGSFTTTKRIVNLIPELSGVIPLSSLTSDPHDLENVELAILEGEFGVAENGAIWLTDIAMGDRAMPFICQHLALVIRGSTIVHTLHEAYDRIGRSGYDLGIFIAGPSKTADIEQSLVLGAHVPKSLTVFVIR